MPRRLVRFGPPSGAVRGSLSGREAPAVLCPYSAIQAIERAHRQELQELQQKSEWERRDPPLGDAYRQHRYDLCSATVTFSGSSE